jgi:nucleoside phosphorylase
VVRLWRGLELPLGDVGGQKVLIFPIDHMGGVTAAQAAENVIRTWNPGLLMLVGIAGGVRGSSGDMPPGDILVPDQVVGYELAKVTKDGVQRRYEVYRTDADLLHRARHLRPVDWADEISTARPGDPEGRIRPRVHIGPVLSGDKVLADEAAIAELRRAWPTAIGVEMESLGAALVADRNRVPFLMVKAVSDFADARKDDSWRHYAAASAAQFAVALLARCSALLPADPQPRATKSAPDERSCAAPGMHQHFGDVHIPGSAVFGISYSARGDD